VDALNKIWKRKLFGTRALPLRQAAVAALGAVGGSEAERALSEVMASGEAQLQRVAARASEEAQARAKGGGS
jgi:hypothetical protein